ncbi:hypothetical protein GPECTOR_42g819 [Gonium pectorale]|uniref:RING-type domain-containing protein n=1 Tax=Gonium pectorale TaxID=33097 RepID=A0A150G9V1_GONPE|nr:hypothetical protein GPECTOR_42g819 [Gonium pectorale]|eukprot:KXZ46608.1 hypothetical protein GPECTOR_42g819 [Gonium pectorale]
MWHVQLVFGGGSDGCLAGGPSAPLAPSLGPALWHEADRVTLQGRMELPGAPQGAAWRTHAFSHPVSKASPVSLLPGLTCGRLAEALAAGGGSLAVEVSLDDLEPRWHSGARHVEAQAWRATQSHTALAVLAAGLGLLPRLHALSVAVLPLDASGGLALLYRHLGGEVSDDSMAVLRRLLYDNVVCHAKMLGEDEAAAGRQFCGLQRAALRGGDAPLSVRQLQLLTPCDDRAAAARATLAALVAGRADHPGGGGEVGSKQRLPPTPLDWDAGPICPGAGPQSPAGFLAVTDALARAAAPATATGPGGAAAADSFAARLLSQGAAERESLRPGPSAGDAAAAMSTSVKRVPAGARGPPGASGRSGGWSWVLSGASAAAVAVAAALMAAVRHVQLVFGGGSDGCLAGGPSAPVLLQLAPSLGPALWHEADRVTLQGRMELPGAPQGAAWRTHDFVTGVSSRAPVTFPGLTCGRLAQLLGGPDGGDDVVTINAYLDDIQMEWHLTSNHVEAQLWRAHQSYFTTTALASRLGVVSRLRALQARVVERSGAAGAAGGAALPRHIVVQYRGGGEAAEDNMRVLRRLLYDNVRCNVAARGQASEAAASHKFCELQHSAMWPHMARLHGQELLELLRPCDDDMTSAASPASDSIDSAASQPLDGRQSGQGQGLALLGPGPTCDRLAATAFDNVLSALLQAKGIALAASSQVQASSAQRPSPPASREAARHRRAAAPGTAPEPPPPTTTTTGGNSRTAGKSPLPQSSRPSLSAAPCALVVVLGAWIVGAKLAALGSISGPTSPAGAPAPELAPGSSHTPTLAAPKPSGSATGGFDRQIAASARREREQTTRREVLASPAAPLSRPAPLLGLTATAAVAGSDAGGSSGGSEASVCLICLDAPWQHGFLHGGSVHIGVCGECLAALKRGRGRGGQMSCPVCRGAVERTVALYV